MVLGESHDDDVNGLLNGVQAENGLGVDTSSGGNINRSDDVENESLGALGILEVTVRMRLNIARA